jgi:serine protease AprX
MSNTGFSKVNAATDSAIWGFLVRRWMAVWLTATALLVSPLRASSKLGPGLTGLDPNSNVDVIIQYQNAPNNSDHNKVTQLGGTFHRDLGVVNGSHYTIPVSAIQSLANDPTVVAIHPDRKLHSSTTSINTIDYGWMGVLGVNSPNARYAYDGTGVGVAVIDSGIDSNLDLDSTASSGFASAAATTASYYQNYSRVVYSESFVPGDSTTGDAFGHGTHVAGLVAGNGAHSSGFGSFYKIRGIAPGATLLNLRVLDANGDGTDSSVIAAIQTAISLQNQYNIGVINLSLGRPVYESYANDPLCQAVEQAWQAGIVVVVAAGNDGRDNSAGTYGYGTITAPGNDPYVITVGAMNTNGTLTRQDDQMTTYSSKGPTLLDHVVKPDLVAPGNRVLSLLAPGSTLDQLYPQNEISPSLYSSMPGFSTYYFELSGTSMATPMTSGGAALLLEQNPNLSPDQVKAILMKYADKTFAAAVCPSGVKCTTPAMEYTTATDPVTGLTYTTYYDIFTVGAGYLDINAAINSNDVPPANTNAMSPTASFNSSNGTVTLVTGSSIVWGTNADFASSIVWGSSVLSGNSIVWGTSIIWGTSAVQNMSIVWGSSIIWGTGTAAAESSTLSLNGDQ